METFTMIWGTLSVGIVLLIKQIKSYYKTDLPFVTFLMAFIFNGVAIWLVALLLKMPWDWNVFWPVIKDAALISFGTQAVLKTGEKNGVNIPLYTPKADHSS